MKETDGQEMDFRKAYDFCQQIVSEPVPDYADDADDEVGLDRRSILAATIKEKLQVV